MPEEQMMFLIITGLSGAGKTRAIRWLEDMGFFCVDNLPPDLITKFAELCKEAETPVKRVAVVVDIRGGEFFTSTREALEELDQLGIPYRIYFLEADNDILVQRYKETRRRHPLAPKGRISEGIVEERRRLEYLRGRAHRIIDTSNMTPVQLRDLLAEELLEADDLHPKMQINLVSFGFKHGVPIDADLVFDVRFLPNPHYVSSLRDLTGDDAPVQDYVMQWPVTAQYLEKLWALLEFSIPQYVNEGKSQLTIAIGCTGGRHRSVTIVNYLAEKIRKRFPGVYVEHRDVRRKEIGGPLL